MNSQRVTRSSESNQNIQLTPMQENVGRRRQREQTEEPNERALPKPKIEKLSSRLIAFKVTDQNIRDSIKKYFNEPGAIAPIGEWDVSKVTNMENLFNVPYNKDELGIDTSLFNIDISGWNVSNVINMNGMFFGCKEFNQPLNDWNVSNVTSMEQTLTGAEKFDQPLNEWNVSNVEYFGALFAEAKLFNQPLNKWNMGKAKFTTYMFHQA
jgi:surface protein